MRSARQILVTFCLRVLSIDTEKHNVSVFVKNYGTQSAVRRRHFMFLVNWKYLSKKLFKL